MEGDRVTKAELTNRTCALTLETPEKSWPIPPKRIQPEIYSPDEGAHASMLAPQTQTSGPQNGETVSVAEKTPSVVLCCSSLNTATWDVAATAHSEPRSQVGSVLREDRHTHLLARQSGLIITLQEKPFRS